MSYIVVIGSTGRMSQDLQNLFREKKIDYRLYSSKAASDLKVLDFKGSAGVIDFSKPESQKEIADKVYDAGVPWVCGTTGWSSTDVRDEIFKKVSNKCPVLFDSNFSLGIEILCRAGEELARSLKGPFFISDYHHAHKKDSPSGTALKIADRMKNVSPDAQIEFRDFRAGNIAGEHQIFVGWEQEAIQFSHRAQSKRAFSEGAYRALLWLQKQKPGFYRMKDLS